ncbi:MAG: DUF4105 domain-containing protein, partial [Gammaproteobacteria bacterium]|nr:DUF4105 domain-containing protein [Gammaproteobacteria bacterium]
MIQAFCASLLHKKYHLLFWAFLLLPINAIASTNQDDAINHAIKTALWENREWLNLLHYDGEQDNYLSQVDDSRFFYATDGKFNPESELIETLKKLFTQTDNPNQQTQCQFVARSEWLSKQLNIDKKQLPVVQCDEYIEWQKTAQADTVTMIFPAYHLNSPSSMFGHTLLRLDKSDRPKSEWLSLAVNFGAHIDNSDNTFVYAYQGLVGGYPGIFITEPYFKKIQEYGRIEHRDIWEYKLNLTAEETRLMINHLWELKNINFDYYFFDENCSYRLLELLEVARPAIELTDQFSFTTIPVNTVRAIEEAQIIESIRYRPAQATKIQFKLDEMPEQYHDIVIQLSNDINTSKSKAFTDLTTQEQKNIADLAYRYLRYENTQGERNAQIAKRSHQLLQLLNSYSAEININSDIPAPVRPEKSHKSIRASIAAGKRFKKKYAEINYKMTFHHLEDNKNGFLQGAQINMGNLKLRAEENIGLRLYQFDIVDIFSLTPRNQFFKPLSWKVYTGLERQITKNKDQLTYHVTGGAGGSWKIITNHQYYA